MGMTVSGALGAIERPARSRDHRTCDLGELLNAELFDNVLEAPVVIEDWRIDYDRTPVFVGLAVGSVSGCLAVLADESAAGGMSSHRLAGAVGDDFTAAWCTLS
jgi:hypothetical protein